MDAFFAAVEQHDRPELRGKPVLVGGSSQGRGVVAAASYKARRFGCHSAMPMKRAIRLCPDAIVVPPHFARYREISLQLLEIFHQITPLVEPLSLDEAFLDITHRVDAKISPQRVAEDLKHRVRQELGLPVSCGVATSKSVAKIASDREKPDGCTVVPPGSERDFLAPLPVGDLWGIGPKTTERLHKAGVNTVSELVARPLPGLIERFGVRGEWFHRLAAGDDDRPVQVTREAKSVSAEETFAEDISDTAVLADVVRTQAQRVATRLRRSDLRGRTVHIKLRLEDFTTFTRRHTLPAPTDRASQIERAALEFLRAETGGGRRFRLVGTGVSNLTASEVVAQLSLFDRPSHPPTLDAAVRTLRDRYGDETITWAAVER